MNNNPLAPSVTDQSTAAGAPATTVTTTVDPLGRTRSYSDAWGDVTTTTYDAAGRPAQQSSPVGVQTMSYDGDGNQGPTVYDGATLATPHYDSAGRLDSVDYANGIKSDPVVRDALGRETSSTWRRSSGGTVLESETLTLNKSGQVTDLVTDGNDPRPGADNYIYDNAGRLTQAWTTTRDSAGTIGSLHSTYGFGTASSSCPAGTQATAGKNTNRTSRTIGDGSTAVTTTYCYDAADRLVSTSQPGAGTITYDGHGNTTHLYNELRTYDASEQHLTTVKDGTTVTYVRDGTGRIITRTSSAGPADTERYGFTSAGDSPGLTLDAVGAVIERTIGLPGGALVTMRSGNQVWSLPNMHGDTTLTTDSTGTVQGQTRTYDPFGDTTGQPLVDNSAGNLDYGWLGEHQRPTEHETGLAPTIEMGARQYDPTLGRFLEVDPIEGGSANDYDYVNADPINSFDYDGTWSYHWTRPHINIHVWVTARLRSGGHAARAGLRWGWNKARTSTRACDRAYVCPFTWAARAYIRGWARGAGLVARGFGRLPWGQPPIVVPCSLIARYCRGSGPNYASAGYLRYGRRHHRRGRRYRY